MREVGANESACSAVGWERALRVMNRLRQRDAQATLEPLESVLEKPESLANPDLGSARSSKAHRLTRIKPGFYHPPSRPIFVPGFRWIGLALAGLQGTPTVAALQWWTNRGERATDKRTEEVRLLERVSAAWGQRVCHIFDQGFAGAPWLQQLFAHDARFILRWPSRYKLADVAGTVILPGNSSGESAPGTIVCSGMRAAIGPSRPECWQCRSWLGPIPWCWWSPVVVAVTVPGIS